MKLMVYLKVSSGGHPHAPKIEINFVGSLVGSQAVAALALRDALRTENVKGFKKLYVEGDSNLIIDKLNPEIKH
ncbi:hypothetical protein DVH24_034901 [Malus domestica]|uniref:Uncharacterized protein n=1 Tax=Malus domestica TaxID=3750 RepID=A0A498IE66_MALDO|nr:hypothetical protein DVH24_034901 [Malus domestica]